PNVNPYPAPAALIEHCIRRPRTSAAASTGGLDPGQVAAFVTWCYEHEIVEAYEDWVSLGMALKLELGDAGLDVWELATWDEAKELAQSKWASFSTEPGAGSVTLNSWFDKARAAGWRGTVGKSLGGMFGGDTVAKIAAQAGAGLASQH